MSEWNQKQLLGKVKDNAKSMDPVTGTSVNIATAVVDLDVRQFRDTEFIIANTGSNTLYYSVRVRSEYETEPDFTVFSNSVAAGDEDEIRRIRVEEDGTIEMVYRMSMILKGVDQEFKEGMGPGCVFQRDVCFKVPEKFDPVTLAISLNRERDKFLAESLTIKIEEVKDEL